MKKQTILTIIGIIISFAAYAGKENQVSEVVLDVSCGQCQFGMEGSGCDLAVKINGNNYWVVGAKIDDHGDAHAEDGFCNAIRKAKVSGTIKGDKFIVESLVLIEDDDKE